MKQLLSGNLFFIPADSTTFSIDYAANVRRKLLGIAKAYFFLLIFEMIWGYLTFYLEKHGIIPLTKGSGNLNAWATKMPISTFIWQVILLAPLLEETAFRGILQRKPSLQALSVTVLVYLLVCKTFGLAFYTLSLSTGLVLAGSTLLWILLYQWNSLLLTELTKRLDRNRSVLIWLSAIGFAFWHYHNYNFDSAGIVTILIILFPLFISGLFFSWASLRYGFIWGILLHILCNALPVMLAVL